MNITPEMSSKILDESHFHFHVTCKAQIINAVNKLRQGKDFLKTLMKAGFHTEKRWTKNSCNDPNVKVMLDILEEYKRVEHRPSRLYVVVPIVEYAIGLYASDLFWRERGEWWLTQIINRAPEMRFYTCFCDPENWYPKRRATPETFNEEQKCPDINDEYSKWYGITNVENPVISYDMMQEMIRQQRELYEKESNAKWAEEELKCLT
jgi:hypothetical protein